MPVEEPVGNRRGPRELGEPRKPWAPRTPRRGYGSLAERGTGGGGHRARQLGGVAPRASSSALRTGDGSREWCRAGVGARVVGRGCKSGVQPAEWGLESRRAGGCPFSQWQWLPFSSRCFCDERKLGLAPLQLGAATSQGLRSPKRPLQQHQFSCQRQGERRRKICCVWTGA